ncbi:hypothetical protein TNCV_1837311 [Trichonephila clavipes]|nr:hypothetical protein TNCV_1837311 [Trichonephila clavipes]
MKAFVDRPRTPLKSYLLIIEVITSIGAICQRMSFNERHARECNVPSAFFRLHSDIHTSKKERMDVSPRHSKTGSLSPQQ